MNVEVRKVFLHCICLPGYRVCFLTFLFPYNLQNDLDDRPVDTLGGRSPFSTCINLGDLCSNFLHIV